MNVLSLCSGVGGLDLGLERAGMTPVGFCELDPWARAVLARHWPDVPCHDDITTLDGTDWHGRVDLVAGGTPCTDLSVAGRRAGLAGEHSRIFWDFCRVATDTAARWVLWENVAGALSSNGGEDFAAVLWGLTGFRPAVPEDGWRSIGVCVGPDRTAVWRLLDARWFGVAQRRRRVFVVAGPGEQCSLSLLVEPESVPRGARPSGATGEVVAALTANGVGAGGGVDDNAAQAGHVIPALTTRCGTSQDDQQAGQLVPVSFNHIQDPIHGVDMASSLTTDGLGVLAVSENQRGKPGQGYPAVLAPAYPLTTRGRNGEPVLEVGEPDLYPALRAGDGEGRQNKVLTPDLAVRRLTPRECERLMGWPDDWTRWTADGTEIADSHRYRMCGNGVVPNCTEWVGRRLMAVAT